MAWRPKVAALAAVRVFRRLPQHQCGVATTSQAAASHDAMSAQIVEFGRAV